MTYKKVKNTKLKLQARANSLKFARSMHVRDARSKTTWRCRTRAKYQLFQERVFCGFFSAQIFLGGYRLRRSTDELLDKRFYHKHKYEDKLSSVEKSKSMKF